MNFLNIGNCGEPFDTESFRLLGSLDELIILDRALTASKITVVNREGSR